jgi:hypothetical protein
LILFSGQIGAYHAVTGARRRSARHRAAPAMPHSSRRSAPMLVEIDFVPQGGAKAP